MNIKKCVTPFILIIIIVTLRISSIVNNESYYDELKIKFKQEIDIVSLAKDFFGNFNTYIFKEDDFIVSNTDVLTKLEDYTYYVETIDNELLSKNSGICVSIIKKDIGYEVTIKNDVTTIVYKELLSCNIKIYDYVNQYQDIGKLNHNESSFYYVMMYEN